MAARAAKRLKGRLCIEINANPPDARVRDIDNLCKAVLDSLEYSGVYKNDSQVDRLIVTRREKVSGGQVNVLISEWVGC